MSTPGVGPQGKRARKEQPAARAAGWYRDPTGAAGKRYHDGTNWTSRYTPDVTPVNTGQRVAKWIAITVATLAFGGCTYLALQPAEPETTRSPSSTKAAPLTHGPQSHMELPVPEPTVALTKFDIFMQVIRNDGITISEADAKIIAANVCTIFGDRPNFTKMQMVLALSIKHNWEPGKATTFASAAVNSFCPEYESRPFE